MGTKDDLARGCDRCRSVRAHAHPLGQSDEQFWRVFYASGSLLAIIDAIWASRVLDAVEEEQD
ncbi:hypothetical protein [Prochlorococcus sp. MIT 0703]|uniref:hypothetical protein n=1 Tax=Prochlorococcus sp. MIT 0703 TaxID=1499504 RepID=UPI0039A5C8C3